MFDVLLLIVSLVVFTSTARAQDQDIVPARTGMFLQLLSYDATTGLLHGYTAGSAGTGTVTVKIVPESKPRPGGLGRFPDTPNRALADVWNLQTKLNPTRVFGPVSSSPFSAILVNAAAQQGYARVKLARDRVVVKIVKLSWPKTAIDVCPPFSAFASNLCCEVRLGSDFACILFSGIDNASAAAFFAQCDASGGSTCNVECRDRVSSDFSSCWSAGGTIDMCAFQADDPPPYRCTKQFSCSTDLFGVPLGTACLNNGGNLDTIPPPSP